MSSLCKIVLLSRLLTKAVGLGMICVGTFAQEVVQRNDLVAWGHNGDGQLDIPNLSVRVKDVAAGGGIHGNHTVLLLEDGTLVAWGANTFGQLDVPPGLDQVVSVRCGAYHNVALRADGKVVAWGWDEWGQSTVPVGLDDVMAIAAGTYHSLALLRDGTVVAWGGVDSSTYQVDYGQTTVPEGLSDVIDIAGGRNFSAALRSDGTVVAWGDGRLGELDIPAGLTGVVEIETGRAFTLALKNDGTVVVWGDNRAGQLNVPTGLHDVVSIATGPRQGLAVQRDGKLFAWGWISGRAYVPEGLEGVTKMSGGAEHSLALLGQTTESKNIHPQLEIDGVHFSEAGRQLRFLVRDQDGVLLGSKELARFRLFGSTNVSGGSTWTPVEFSQGSSGGFILIDESSAYSSRFFHLRTR